MIQRLIVALLGSLLTACSSGAVVFAPTPLPPDLSPAQYTHPSGAFSVVVPRTWAVYEQNRTNLATASFSPPGSASPVLVLAVIKPNPVPDVLTFELLVGQYQTQVRPDVERYKENSREFLPDGSWRMTGLRATPLGATEQVNTFVEADGPVLGVLDITLSDAVTQADVERAVNTFDLNPDAALETALLSTLNGIASASLSILHVSAWTTPDGVFYITGEIANDGAQAATDLPITATLYAADGALVAEAGDLVMGYGVSPGGFAPFSLRFGQGQPPGAVDFGLTLGADWQPGVDQLLGIGTLAWTDSSSRDSEGRLVIHGNVTNISEVDVHDARATVTVFDAAQNVVGARFEPVDDAELAPGESSPFSLIVPEIGGQPANYIVSVQGLP